MTIDKRIQTEMEAAAFRRLVRHLRHRTDVQNIDLMGHSGFCRNCLGDWLRDAAAARDIALSRDEARELVYGMAPGEWKDRYQSPASDAQIARMNASVAKNAN